MLVKLTSPGADLYVDLTEVVAVELQHRPNTTMILPNEKVYYTMLSMKNGKVFAVLETPEEIINIIKLLTEKKSKKVSA